MEQGTYVCSVFDRVVVTWSPVLVNVRNLVPCVRGVHHPQVDPLIPNSLLAKPC